MFKNNCRIETLTLNLAKVPSWGAEKLTPTELFILAIFLGRLVRFRLCR
jgi:hypothetical protein